MSHQNFVKIKRQVITSPDNATVSPFLGVGIRQMARHTGLDASYLSRVKSGKMPVTEQRYEVLCKAWQELSEEGDSK